MSNPVALGRNARAVMDAWADKIVSQQALPDNVVGLMDNGGGLIERRFIFEVFENTPIFAVVNHKDEVRAASTDEYAEVERAITEGRFVISEHIPAHRVTVVIHEAKPLPAPKRILEPDSGPGL